MFFSNVKDGVRKAVTGLDLGTLWKGEINGFWIKIKKRTSVEHETFVGKQGELTMDTTKCF